MRPLRWAYGVMTCGARSEYLENTLKSLKDGGFPDPHLFVDGVENDYLISGRPFTVRRTPVGPYGNWILGIAELFIRSPACHRYVLFQDDFECYRNLRQYLDTCNYPQRGYMNLHTFLNNEEIVHNRPVGWYEASVLSQRKGVGYEYEGKKQQCGLSAVALVFNREALLKLLASQHMIERPMDANRGTRFIDGAVVEAMNRIGWREYVHNPSLVRHLGVHSAIGNQPYPAARTFKGSHFDAMELKKCV